MCRTWIWSGKIIFQTHSGGPGLFFRFIELDDQVWYGIPVIGCYLWKMMDQIISDVWWFHMVSGWWFQTLFIFHFIYGMSSFPLTNSYFSRWLKPPAVIWLEEMKINHHQPLGGDLLRRFKLAVVARHGSWLLQGVPGWKCLVYAATSTFQHLWAILSPKTQHLICGYIIILLRQITSSDA